MVVITGSTLPRLCTLLGQHSFQAHPSGSRASLTPEATQ